MQRYFAAVLTSNHRSSTPDPGATSLGSMAYLQCCGRGCWFQWAGRSEGSLQPVSAVCVGRPRFQRPRTTLEPLWLEQPKLSTRDRTQRRSRVCWRAPQARPWGARALLRAGRRGDEASGEDSMLTPEKRGRQRRLFSGDSWRCLATTFERWQHRRRRCDTDRCGEALRITQDTE